jgi:hypothetical protein
LLRLGCGGDSQIRTEPEDSGVFFPPLSPTARLMLVVPEGSPVCPVHPPQQWKSDNTNLSAVTVNVVMLLHLS